MVSIDTNILLRMILGDVKVQITAIRSLLEKHDIVAVSDLTITEVVYVLEKSQGVSRALICEFINSLLSNQHLNINRPLFQRVLPLYEKHRTESFNDCCLSVYATLNNQVPLYTFDKKMARDLPGVELVQQ